MADPGVVADLDALGGAALEEGVVIGLAVKIPARAIGEVVQRWAPLSRLSVVRCLAVCLNRSGLIYCRCASR